MFKCLQKTVLPLSKTARRLTIVTLSLGCRICTGNKHMHLHDIMTQRIVTDKNSCSQLRQTNIQCKSTDDPQTISCHISTYTCSSVFLPSLLSFTLPTASETRCRVRAKLNTNTFCISQLYLTSSF